MPVLVIYLFLVVPIHTYNVHADQNTVILSTDRSIFTSESPKNKLSSPSLSAEKVLDEGYDQSSITEVPEFDNYEEYEDEYHARVTLYTDHNGRGDFAKFHETEISKNEKISMEKIYSNITLPPGLHGFLVKNVSCIVYNTHHLNCSLAVENISKGAQYSFTVHRDDSLLSCDSFINNEARVVKCNGKIDYKDYFTLKINVTVADFQYVHRQQFEAVQIEKLNPPHNVTASFISGNLYIAWNLNSNLRSICFLFQLKINHSEELLEVFKQMNFTILNIDETQSYKIQIRVTKSDSCRKNDIWSDWSGPVVVNPRIKPDALNVPMICGISLGIPMLLLAVFLPCWRSRLFNKLFPPVPSPSVKIQELLEKDDVIQGMQFRYLEEIVKVEDDSD